jgi:uncharacterized repeat protein (TIGR04076 family)
MARPKVKITLIDKKGEHACRHGHKIGDSFEYEKDLNRFCPMALHAGFPYLDILRYGGSIPGQPEGQAVFCCPDADVINIFRIELLKENK